LDVNNYRQSKIDFLNQLARDSAYRAQMLKKEIALKPMPAYERRLIHLSLSSNKNVVTESRGEEPERYVVVIPKEK
jgi:spoIIIJ-associated protein